MEIERIVEQRKQIGFKCDLCQKSFRTDMYYEEESWEYSDRARLFMDIENPNEDESPFEYADFCKNCFLKLADHIKNQGGKFHHI